MPFGVKMKSLKSFGNKITSGASKFGNKIASGVNDAVSKAEDVGNMIANKAQDVGNQIAKGEKVFNNVLGKVADVSAIATPLLAAGLSATGVGLPISGALLAGNKALQVGQDAYAKGRGVAKSGIKQVQSLGNQVVGDLKALGNQAITDVKNSAIRIGDEIVSNGQQAITNGLQRQ